MKGAWSWSRDQFLPARRYASASISRHRVYVCLSVTLSQAGTAPKRLNVGSGKQRHVIAQRLLFTDANNRWWATLHFPWNLCSKWPTPFRTQRFRPISAHKERKGKERKRIYIAPFIYMYYVYLKALRHGSHSFTCKYTMPAFPSYAFTRWRYL